MNDEINELENEIALLKQRISILEKKENHRKSLAYIRLIIKMLLIGILIFGIWKGYEYVVHEIPNMMEEKIHDLNPFKNN